MLPLDVLVAASLLELGTTASTERRLAAERVRDIGMRSRRSLAKRGTLALAAESPLQDPAAVDALGRALSDPDDNVRLSVAMCLGDLGDASCVERLSGILSDRNVAVGVAAANALSEIGGAIAARLLA